MNFKTTVIATAATLGILGAAAYAQPFMQPVHDMQGMMGGYGPGSGYGRMDRSGPGAGPMYGYGMGPGMMGGWGGHMGPGTMDRWGGHMGPGMTGGPYGGIHRLNLTDNQRDQLRKIEDEARRKNWDLMGRMQDEMAKLSDGWAARKTDRATILAANKRMFELRQQMLENRLDAQEKVEGLLTPQQREQLEKWSRSWSGDGN